MSDDLLTTAEVAAYFQVDPASVRRWVKSGRLAAIKTPGGGSLRFRRSDIEQCTEGERDGDQE